MIITRNIINPNIKYKDYVHNQEIRSYDFAELSQKIDGFKNYLVDKYNCQPGEKILIACKAGIAQTALIFAAAELGLTIVVVDYQRDDGFTDKNYIDPKTRLLMPIDYFVLDIKKPWDHKFTLFNNISENIFFVLNHAPMIEGKDGMDDYRDIAIFEANENGDFIPYDLDTTPNNLIRADQNTVLMTCTSSGTTGTPKVIQHMHGFIHALITRNQSMYYGRVGVVINLQHGSSFATYFLPAICSENVTCILNLKTSRYEICSALKLDHVMLPYTFLIENFFNAATRKSLELNLYTLGYIKNSWLDEVQKGKAKDVISIFGSNETSGPVLLNKLSDPNFSETRYVKVDDFYDININENGEMIVGLPVYENKTISTNDLFRIENNAYYHLGRSDLIRIKDFSVDAQAWNTEAKKILNCDFVFDTVHQKIYLSVWESDEGLVNKIKSINTYLSKVTGGLIQIDKSAVLVYENFLSGIKLDQELLRDHFRNNV